MSAPNTSRAAGLKISAMSSPKRRLAEMRDFYQFLLAELPGLLHRREQSRTPR
ncbi:hypothetical protein [Nonomuraea sp. NPDC049758]|uniref:hypothetical protein n=1 Tax=Nonomuraea sp. NPDC049758 TaxID=3154360 RepID=UPI00342F86F7